jgi:hypothetical protein
MASAPSDAGPKKRLVIKQMVLENFKSYAGAQHVGPFHKVGFGFGPEHRRRGRRGVEPTWIAARQGPDASARARKSCSWARAR